MVFKTGIVTHVVTWGSLINGMKSKGNRGEITLLTGVVAPLITIVGAHLV